MAMIDIVTGAFGFFSSSSDPDGHRTHLLDRTDADWCRNTALNT
jgi:hypothetical protein